MSTPEATDEPYDGPQLIGRGRAGLGFCIVALLAIPSLRDGAWVRAGIILVSAIALWLISSSQWYQKKYRRRWDRRQARKAAERAVHPN
jgi:hypothetical protein